MTTSRTAAPTASAMPACRTVRRRFREIPIGRDDQAEHHEREHPGEPDGELAWCRYFSSWLTLARTKLWLILSVGMFCKNDSRVSPKPFLRLVDEVA